MIFQMVFKISILQSASEEISGPFRYETFKHEISYFHRRSRGVV